MNTNRNPRHSGYAGSVDDWRKFLSCWHHEARRRKGYNVTYSLVKRDVLARPPDIGDDAIREEIKKHEKRLGLRLPRSYVDFLIAYYPTETTLKDLEFLHISAIDKLDKVFPGWGTEWAASGANPDDADYFTFGTEQVDVTRARYIKTTLAVGMHDSDSPFMLLLHPEVLTSDGEMEAEAFFHAGSARTPSFAEMMRRLYYSKVRPQPGSPPISQEMMRGSCADLLPMTGVWWK